ncbi:MAG: fasciclin domain-containing protein [Fimbriimonas sp.]
MIHPQRFLFALAAGVMTIAPALAVEPGPTPSTSVQIQEGRDLDSILRSRRDLSTFNSLTQSAGVTRTPFTSPGTDGKGYTLFVPSNNAFAKLPPQVLSELQRNRDLMDQVLRYHIVAGRVRSSDLNASMDATTLQGERLQIDRSGNRVMAGSAIVIERDQTGTNGVIHIIDRVLLPPTIRDNFIRRAILPLNDARAEALGRRANDQAKAQAQARDTGGGSSRTDRGMEGTASSSLPRTTGGRMTGSGRAARIVNRARGENLMAVATATSDLSTFQRLATEAGIGNWLMDGTYTVFAPTDAAFANLPAMAMDALTMDKELLKSVLLYHVARGEMTASELRRGSIRAASGGSLYVKVGAKGAAKVNDAIVLDTDLMAKNGAIHTINKVLIPPAVAASLRAKGIVVGD